MDQTGKSLQNKALQSTDAADGLGDNKLRVKLSISCLFPLRVLMKPVCLPGAAAPDVWAQLRDKLLIYENSSELGRKGLHDDGFTRNRLNWRLISPP